MFSLFLFADPDTFEPSLAFFSVIELTESQDAVGLKTALEEALKSKDMDIMDKTVFLASDGASVNSGLKSGLITLFKEERPWITFVWCLSHRLELALKDSLTNFMAPVDESYAFILHV